jgi:hypothetical protein
MSDFDTLRQVVNGLAEHAQQTDERFLEIDAKLNAQRYLLEQAYANAFLANPAGFDQFIDGALSATSEKSTASEPMQDDYRVELTVGVAKHLARFGDAVKQRLRS